MPAPFRIMTVCTGNICRSPMAEAVLRARFDAAGLGDRVVVDSGGTSSEELGNPVDPRAARVLQDAGYAVPDGTAHQVTPQDIGEHDLLLPMTVRHANHLRRQARTADDAAKVRMYRSFDPESCVAPERDLDIDDPWYGDDAGFVATLRQIEAAADAIVEHVRGRLPR
ncbi:low molecular weight protein-tyrosine-phosphatase [Amnibacterium kyonggiense]|uniref:protein-tyrosine-phosphatase n=1 Tax=Amnibacterium kyonggiense TaxID=595671 RepID=A0A4R7FQ69_9MICO|nr:low molecular weight protein-tyrosine-phosphatase [Amnibacterium kyonggiense]TDS79915.1 protein-tyrosine phosphatase [Amnibacterium kyonggiense]